eukprot:Nk52_evm45s1992 gene=Nk52_evmTU45s1992
MWTRISFGRGLLDKLAFPGRESYLLHGQVGLFRYTILKTKYTSEGGTVIKGLNSFLVHARSFWSKSNSSKEIVIHQRYPNSKTKWKAYYSDGSVRTVSGKEGERLPPTSDEVNSKSEGFSLNLAVSARIARSRFLRVFFPKGYPETVPDNFMSYSIWQAIQMSSGAACGVLSMQALLYAVGLGAGAIPLAAALNWIIKDGLGQLGGVLYASLVNSKFDSDPKFHRFYAIVVMQLATFVEICTPMFPGLFLPLAALSNIGKNIAWLAGSATRAQMHLSFARVDNLGDITAKITSQTIASTLIGTGFGVGFSSFIGTDPSNIMLAFFPLSAITLYANFRSICVVRMETLNEQRSEHIFRKCIVSDPHGMPKLQRNIDRAIEHLSLESMCYEKVEQLDHSSSEPVQKPTIDSHAMSFMTPEELSAIEQFVLPYKSSFKVPMIMEPSIESAFPDSVTRANALKEFMNHKSFIGREHYHLKVTRGTTSNDFKVLLWLHLGLSSYDRLQGFFHSCVLRYMVEKVDFSKHSDQDAALEKIIRLSHDYTLDVFPEVFSGLQDAGWTTQNVFVGEQGGRIHHFKKDMNHTSRNPEDISSSSIS